MPASVVLRLRIESLTAWMLSGFSSSFSRSTVVPAFDSSSCAEVEVDLQERGALADLGIGLVAQLLLGLDLVDVDAAHDLDEGGAGDERLLEHRVGALADVDVGIDGDRHLDLLG